MEPSIDRHLRRPDFSISGSPDGYDKSPIIILDLNIIGIGNPFRKKISIILVLYLYLMV
jgi:hypothetical protein